VFIAELRDFQDILPFVEIVAVVAVGEYFGIGVAYPGRIDIGDCGKAAGLRGEPGWIME